MSRANDAIDRQLIALLQANARETTTALASMLGVARTTIQERMARLENNGTIVGYSAILARNPFDSYTEAMVMIALSNSKMKDVVDRLRTLPEIKLCQSIDGDFNLVCQLEVPRVEDLDALLDEVAEIPGIEKIRSWVILATRFDRRGRTEDDESARHAFPIGRGEAG
ncbi:Lrp/AsnC family transcriptional regulator [Paraburkholderia sp.]|uniref:Lrp/AsnC family transcriptional regulator n=1 Tax=Paraburkholderia sp. TaxID=1926495 RepID=UPI0039E29EDB